MCLAQMARTDLPSLVKRRSARCRREIKKIADMGVTEEMGLLKNTLQQSYELHLRRMQFPDKRRSRNLKRLPGSTKAG
jgi:hypothetical protein